MYEIIKLKTASRGRGLNSVLIIYTGGTMGMSFDKEDKRLVPFDFSRILEHLPELYRFELELTIISFEKPMDSSNMKPSNWIDLANIIFANYETYDGFVILHGTDTMAYTASALSFLLENLNKPVILTGAQLPIGMVRTDARENFVTSLEIASTKRNNAPLITEVCVYFDYFLLRGNRSKKVQSSHFDAFVSENYPQLAEAGVTIEYNEQYLKKETYTEKLKVYDYMEENVWLLKLFPGMSEKYVRTVLSMEGLKGVVMETFGSGNAPTDKWFLNCLEEATKKGITIVNVSQCLGGKVDQTAYQTSKGLQQIGVISGGNMTTEAAMTKLMFVLGNREFKGNVRKALSESLRGEMN